MRTETVVSAKKQLSSFLKKDKLGRNAQMKRLNPYQSARANYVALCGNGGPLELLR